MTIALLLRNTLLAAKLQAAGTLRPVNLRRLDRGERSRSRARSRWPSCSASAGSCSAPRRAHRRARERHPQLGWLAALILLAAIVAALAMVFACGDPAAAAIPGHRAVLTAALGALAVLAIAVRLILQPGLGGRCGQRGRRRQPPAILGLISALAIAAGGWRAVADERTETADSRQQTEDVLRVRGAPRPAPPRSNPAGPAQS
jgi:hypothetical protein